MVVVFVKINSPVQDDKYSLLAGTSPEGNCPFPGGGSIGES